MAWTSPDGFEDPDSVWTDEEKAYDGNTETYAYDNYTRKNLILTFTSPVETEKCRLYAHPGVGDVNLTIYFYYDGAYHSIFSGIITSNEWVEKINSAGAKTVSQIKVVDNVSAGLRLHEFELEEYIVGRQLTVKVTTTQPHATNTVTTTDKRIETMTTTYRKVNPVTTLWHKIKAMASGG